MDNKCNISHKLSKHSGIKGASGERKTKREMDREKQEKVRCLPGKGHLLGATINQQTPGGNNLSLLAIVSDTIQSPRDL